MKTILIFSNPFGYGPAGKAAMLATYIARNTRDCSVHFVGPSSFVSDRAITVHDAIDERSVDSIASMLESISGEKFVLSSQNRFAIQAAMRSNTPTAFIDGLAWFWGNIPEDHFQAPLIFWPRYPNISDKIPEQYKSKINMFGAILENEKSFFKRDGILLYIGGCKNPMLPIPLHYLDLIATLIEKNQHFISGRAKIATDLESKMYILRKHPTLISCVDTYKHRDFLARLSSADHFITNGGQTATIEAFGIGTPVSFFLPMNLSQMALSGILQTFGALPSRMAWGDYADISKNIQSMNEKQGMLLLDNLAKKILSDRACFEKVKADFDNLISRIPDTKKQTEFLAAMGTSGCEDIFRSLQTNWGIS